MTINWAQLCQVALTGVAVSVYGPVPANTQVSIDAAQVGNSTGSPIVVTVYIVPNGGSANSATFVDEIQVSANSAQPVIGLLNQKLTAGMSLFAVGNGATLTVSGKISA